MWHSTIEEEIAETMLPKLSQTGFAIFNAGLRHFKSYLLPSLAIAEFSTCPSSTRLVSITGL
jgi:hypothetical protein